MMRGNCCSTSGSVLRRKGPWTAEEDQLLANYIRTHGEGPWKCLPHRAGLLRCGKSCRLRWINYLRPDIRRGNITPDEDDIIIRMHMLLGNRWSLIAGRLPGRTDNEIKNYWNTHLCKKMKFQSSTLPLGSTRLQLPFRHGINDKDNIHQTNVHGEGHVYDNEPKYKKCRSVESTEISVKIYTPKPIRISTTTTTNSSSRVQVWTPKPIRVTASCLSKTLMYAASNVTCAVGNVDDDSCNGRGGNCKLLIEEVHKFFDNEDCDLQEQNHCYEICTDHRLGIADGCWKVPHQGNSEKFVNYEPKTDLQMVYQEYLQLLHRQD